MSFWDSIKELFGGADLQETVQNHVPLEEVQQQVEDVTQQASEGVEGVKDQGTQAIDDAKSHLDNQ